MNSYAMAFGILGGGLLLALVLWSVPVLRRRKAVRRFRTELDHIDFVSLAWRQSLVEGGPGDNPPTPLPEIRRQRRPRRGQPDDGGATLV